MKYTINISENTSWKILSKTADSDLKIIFFNLLMPFFTPVYEMI